MSVDVTSLLFLIFMHTIYCVTISLYLSPLLFSDVPPGISPAELQNDSDTSSSDAHVSPARSVNTLSSASPESQCVGGGTGGPSVSSVPSWVRCKYDFL